VHIKSHLPVDFFIILRLYIPASNMYKNSVGDTSSQPAPADKAQRDSFKQNAHKVGLVQTEKGEHIVVRDYVYLTLWKSVKYVTNESELDFEGLICKNSDEGGKCCR
jgi:hypothetical protein